MKKFAFLIFLIIITSIILAIFIYNKRSYDIWERVDNGSTTLSWWVNPKSLTWKVRLPQVEETNNLWL